MARSQLSTAVLRRPKPATVALVGGRPHVIRAEPGIAFKPRDVAAALLRAIAAKNRTARVRPTLARPSFTGADARKLAIHQQVSSFTVRLPHGVPDSDLAAALTRLDGTVLHPGEALSLRALLGRATPSGAGGDALATATFNAAWLGGLRVTAHSVARSFAATAPVGRDASLREGQDLAFTDDTTYGVLVSAVAHHHSLTVTLWSTPQWQVTSSHADRTNVVPAGRRVVHGTGCTPREGRDGFEVTVTRTFAQGGQVDHASSYTVTYAPRAAVVCRSRHHR
jgi:vancomycin resistance protein YoaR